MRGMATLKATTLEDFSDLQKDYEKGALNTTCLSYFCHLDKVFWEKQHRRKERREKERKGKRKDFIVYFKSCAFFY